MGRNTTSTSGGARPQSVYRFYNSQHELLYVGITSRHLSRAVEHSADKEWFRDVSLTRWEHFDYRWQAEARESYLIKTCHPRYNLAGRANCSRLAIDPDAASRRELAVKLYQDGWNTEDIAELVGLTRRTIYNLLQRAGVERTYRQRPRRVA